MYSYKRTIKSGNVIEVEYYQSIRPRNKKHLGRGIKKSLTPAKQKQANIIRAKRRTQRMILNNFRPGDWWVKFGFSHPVTEEEAEKACSNFLRRYKYYLQKRGKQFKYLGFIECGKREQNWHLHLVIEKSDLDALKKIWGNGSVWVTSLYEDGNYSALADYVRKDVVGKKRLKQSRNLVPPEETVREAGKREMRKLDNGEMIKIPDGYCLVKDETETSYNEYIGTRYRFVFSRV